jgi:hypothetical protein
LALSSSETCCGSFSVQRSAVPPVTVLLSPKAALLGWVKMLRLSPAVYDA